MATPTNLPASFTSGQVLTAAEMNDLRGAFRVQRVVQTVKTDVFSSNSSTFIDITGLTASITPQATSSKILILAQVAFSNPGGSQTMFLRLNGGNSSNYVGDAASNRVRSLQGNLDGANWSFTIGSLVSTFVYLDSPATTSSTTYAVQMRMNGTSTSGTINRQATDTDNNNYGRFASSITLMEISA